MVRGKDKLVNHRDMICHPTVVSWRRKNQAFADAGHKWNNVRAGLVRDVVKQINEALVQYGQEVYMETVPVTLEMGELLRVILASAGKTMTEHEHETANDFYRHLELHRDNFIQILEKFPEGIIPP